MGPLLDESHMDEEFNRVNNINEDRDYLMGSANKSDR